MQCVQGLRDARGPGGEQRSRPYLLPRLLLHHVGVEREVLQLGCFRTPTLGHHSALATASLIHASIASSSTVCREREGGRRKGTLKSRPKRALASPSGLKIAARQPARTLSFHPERAGAELIAGLGAGPPHPCEGGSRLAALPNSHV